MPKIMDFSVFLLFRFSSGVYLDSRTVYGFLARRPTYVFKIEENRDHAHIFFKDKR